MVTCPSCSGTNDDRARFCSSCGTVLARTCPSCGSTVPASARFCPECGASLEATATAGPLEERRLLTILFADLAGFTERSDRADPEDVRGLLMPFHAIAKEEIERFGGVVDKFIGDAALGVFGAPVAHEDDAERAVRSALSIRERLGAEGIPMRVAVNTGEALVTYGEGPQIGERVAGDVVNTASRLQALAPEGNVVVGEATARVTRRVIDYGPLARATVKGKAEPLTLWLARGVRPTVPERDEDDPPRFVGRDRERHGLRDALERTIRERTPHLVTIVGDPGLGKTRLVADLGEYVRGAPGDIAYHRGRCLPYGESITFAALVDIVRALLGVAPGESRERAAEALAERMDALGNEDERTWLEERLNALIGPSQADQDLDRGEAFAAWTRFLERSAGRSPLVVVIEDLHWAERAMLEFVDHLLEQASGVALLVVTTARPELFGEHPSWGAGMTNATTMTLSPLSEHDMQDLLGALLVRSVVGVEARATLMRRAAGNPLYAREFVHMLEDDPPDASTPDGGPTAPVAMPDTIQALIAARMDALSAADRSILQAGAVVGDRFWPGTVGALVPDLDPTVSLHELQRRGLIRRSPLSTIGGQDEFAFSHGLIRDVAYRRLPRAARATMHTKVTRWLEGSAGADVSDRADLLASHAVRALDLARAAGMGEEIPDMERDAMRFLVLAGDHQTGLDARRAADYYAKAVTLAPVAGAERAELIRRATGLGWRSGSMTSDEAVSSYEDAIEQAMAAGEPILAARIMRRLFFQLGLQGQTSEADATLAAATELLEAQAEPGDLLAELYACRSEAEMFAGRSEGSLAWADRALSLPRTDEITLMALHLRGNARCELGDYAGVDDLREALRLSKDLRAPMQVVSSYSYLVERVALLEGPVPALEMNQAAIELCERRGLEHQSMWTKSERLWLLLDAGRWDEIVRLGEELGPWGRDHGEVQVVTVASTYLAHVMTQRGRADHAVEMMDEAIGDVEEVGDLQVRAPALFVSALAAARSGEGSRALVHLRAYHELTLPGPTEYREVSLPEAVRLAIALDEMTLASELTSGMQVHEPRMRRALDMARAQIAEAAGERGEAADAYETLARAWAEWDMPLEAAHAWAGLARCLRAAGGSSDTRADEADARARTAFLGLGMSAPTPVTGASRWWR